MAKSTKSRKAASDTTAETEDARDSAPIADAVVVDDEPAAESLDKIKENTEDVKADATDVDTGTNTQGDMNQPETATDADGGETRQPDSPPAQGIDDDPARGNVTPPLPPAPVVQEKIIEKRGGFVPTVLGGLIAAGIGFGGAQVLGPDYWLFGKPDPFRSEVSQQLAEQTGRIDALSSRVEETAGAVAAIDLAPVTSAVEEQAAALSGIQTSVQDGLSAVQATLGDLQARLDTLEKRPLTEAVSPEAIAAYERELEALRTEIVTQKSEIESLAREAVASEQAANEQAALAAGRTALAEVLSAVDNGEPFSGALARLTTATGAEPPAALAAVAADGVPPLGALIEAFPDAARDALAAARRAEPAADGGGLGSFLERQLGARSLTPQEGNSADAVLSRAEAAVRNGDLAAALAELSALPEAGQAALSDWMGRASARVGALDAAAALSQQLNSTK